MYIKENKIIRIYHTHIEIYPYSLGENERIERMLSVWIDAEYRYNPIGYHIENDTLYVPRGVDNYILEKEFLSTPIVIYECDPFKYIRGCHITKPPRDKIQEDSINFLCAEDKFKNAVRYSQQALILDTGDGKTYTTVHSILKLKMRAIIITHQDKIKNQWINTFKEFTDIPDDKLINITGSSVISKIIKNKISGYIYFVNHQTLNSYLSYNSGEALHNFFKKINVGIKVYDEAHLSFENILRIDFFSDTKKTFYLTANFGRSDSKEDRIFKKVFSSVYQFGEETKKYDTKRKHIIYIPVLYRSNPSYVQLSMANNMYGFSVQGFFKYAFHNDEEQTMLRKFFTVFDSISHLEGKLLITLPKISDTELLKDIIKKEYPSLEKSISTINSSNTEDDNKSAQNSDIIISTIKSCGTGVDIKGLRCIINLEPFSSNIICNQLSGRLREYSKDKDTYFFDLVDISFPTCERQYKSKLKYLKKKCKEIRKWDI